jgi:hypothetical protein
MNTRVTSVDQGSQRVPGVPVYSANVPVITSDKVKGFSSLSTSLATPARVTENNLSTASISAPVSIGDIVGDLADAAILSGATIVDKLDAENIRTLVRLVKKKPNSVMDADLRNGRSISIKHTGNPKFPLLITPSGYSFASQSLYVNEDGEYFEITDPSKITLKIRSSIDGVLQPEAVASTLDATPEYKGFTGSDVTLPVIDIFRTKAVSKDAVASHVHINADHYNVNLQQVEAEISNMYVVSDLVDELGTAVTLAPVDSTVHATACSTLNTDLHLLAEDELS